MVCSRALRCSSEPFGKRSGLQAVVISRRACSTCESEAPGSSSSVRQALSISSVICFCCFLAKCRRGVTAICFNFFFLCVQPEFAGGLPKLPVTAFFRAVKNFSCHHFGKPANLFWLWPLAGALFRGLFERPFLARGVWFCFWVLFFKPNSPARPRCQSC